MTDINEFPQGHTDITSDIVEIRIRNDSAVMWVNTEYGCVLRICQIKQLVLEDERPNDILWCSGCGSLRRAEKPVLNSKCYPGRSHNWIGITEAVDKW